MNATVLVVVMAMMMAAGTVTMRLMRDTVKMKMRMTGRTRQNLGCDRCTARTVGGLWLGQECQLTPLLFTGLVFL